MDSELGKQREFDKCTVYRPLIKHSTPSVTFGFFVPWWHSFVRDLLSHIYTSVFLLPPDGWEGRTAVRDVKRIGVKGIKQRN